MSTRISTPSRIGARALRSISSPSSSRRAYSGPSSSGLPIASRGGWPSRMISWNSDVSDMASVGLAVEFHVNKHLDRTRNGPEAGIVPRVEHDAGADADGVAPKPLARADHL